METFVHFCLESSERVTLAVGRTAVEDEIDLAETGVAAANALYFHHVLPVYGYCRAWDGNVEPRPGRTAGYYGIVQRVHHGPTGAAGVAVAVAVQFTRDLMRFAGRRTRDELRLVVAGQWFAETCLFVLDDNIGKTTAEAVWAHHRDGIAHYFFITNEPIGVQLNGEPGNDVGAASLISMHWHGTGREWALRNTWRVGAPIHIFDVIATVAQVTNIEGGFAFTVVNGNRNCIFHILAEGVKIGAAGFTINMNGIADQFFKTNKPSGVQFNC